MPYKEIIKKVGKPSGFRGYEVPPSPGGSPPGKSRIIKLTSGSGPKAVAVVGSDHSSSKEPTLAIMTITPDKIALPPETAIPDIIETHPGITRADLEEIRNKRQAIKDWLAGQRFPTNEERRRATQSANQTFTEILASYGLDIPTYRELAQNSRGPLEHGFSSRVVKYPARWW